MRGIIRTLAAVGTLVVAHLGGCGNQSAAPGTPVDAAPVNLRITQFGTGGVCRPGSWVGVQVEVSDAAGTGTTREIVLELAMPDAGGDTALYQSVVPIGGETKKVWLYARMPYSVGEGSTVILTAYNTTEASRDQRDAGVAKPGARIAQVKSNLSSSQVIARTHALTGVIGFSDAGLFRYEVSVGQGSPWPAMQHELSLTAAGIKASYLPDRWMGLASFDTILWSGSGPDLDPTDLEDDRASALKDWVRRGGHLVVVLPTIGQSWANPTQPLHDICPRVTINRNESGDLNLYRPLLSDRETIGLPTQSVIQTFDPAPGASSREALPVLAGPDGKTVVVRREVDAGAVTYIGLDIASRTAQGLNYPQADVFWNRVLGRRGITPTPAEIQAQIPGGSNTGTKKWPGLIDRVFRPLDSDIAPLINKTGRAAAGVLLAFFVFGMYWLLAGPALFWFLKRRTQSQHSWVGFFLGGILFTALAWSGATLLRPGRIDAQHLTFLDHIYGQEHQHAKVWISTLLPSYGAMTLAVGAPEATNTHNALAPWDPPPAESTSASASSVFPDARGFGINSRDPSMILAPARSTVKTFTADWAGSPAWAMPLPVNTDGSTSNATLRAAGDSVRPALNGALKHDLPTSLDEVYVFLILGQREIPPNQKANTRIPAVVFWQQRKAWKPGETWDFTEDTSLDTKWQRNDVFKSLIGNVAADDEFNLPTAPVRGGRRNPNATIQQQTLTFGRTEERLAALALFHMLEPPDVTGTANRPLAAQRSEAHGMDICRWFTQPCVVVIGHARNAPCPVPFRLDGEPLGTDGHTVVRWVYPLPSNPPRISTN